MNFKKLSLAAVISISVLTVGNTAKAQVGEFETIQAPIVTQTVPAPIVVDTATPTAVGAGPAGTFKSFGTTQTYGGNAAGSTEIQTFRTAQPIGAGAGLAAQGIYGQCVPCQPAATTGGAAIIPIEPVAPSQVIIRPEPVATPHTSVFTGGA
ncbi:MAG TPA: hypothetical protein DDX14_08370, partial [Cyanobacteria bacterium UBA9579]|nr:hypothetical protein [Cyanobacteria bacterium UBA9579]